MEDNINDITLKCLMNDSIYEKYMKKQEKEHAKNDKIDNINKKKQYKFYKKRVLAITKDLYKKYYDPSYQEVSVSNDVQDFFDGYVESLFEYFKIQDYNDIIQEDLKDIKDTKDATSVLKEDIENFDLLKCNKNMMNNPNEKGFGTLGSFVITKKQKEKEKIPLPRKKKVELYDNKLKKKGIRKKKGKKDNLLK